jgi:hypothetical protein
LRSRTFPLRKPPGRTVRSGIGSQFLDGGGRISTSQAIRQTFIGPRGLIKGAQGDEGGYGKADHEEKASNALDCRWRHIPAHDPPPADEIVKPSTMDYPLVGG